MTAQGYIAWAAREMVEFLHFKPLQVEFPDLAGQAKTWDTALVVNRIGRWAPYGLVVTAVLAFLGTASGAAVPAFVKVGAAVLGAVSVWVMMSMASVVFAFRAADDLSLAQIMSDLDRLFRLVPKPGRLEVFEFYGALVLVFEKPVSPLKRDKLIGVRRSSLFSRCMADMYVVELDAGTMYNVAAPWNIRRFLPALTDVMGRKAEAPALPPVDPGLGQHGRKGQPALAGMALIVLMAIVHLAVHLERHESLVLRLFRSGADNSLHVDLGEYWRMVSSNYLHFNWEHIVGNMIALIEYARAVEPLFGAAWLFAIFNLTGVCGNILSNAAHPVGCGAGASGAVFGLAGVLVSLYMFRREKLSAQFQAHFWGAALMFSAYQFYVGFRYGENIGNWAHLGGFLSGFAIGMVLPFKLGPVSPWGGKWWAAACAAAGLWAASMVWAGWDADAVPDRYVRERDESVRASYEYPESWWRLAGRGEPAVALTNRLGAVVRITRRSERIAGLLNEPDYAIRDMFEKMMKDSFEKQYSGRYSGIKIEIGSIEVSKIPFGGGKGISIKYRVRLSLGNDRAWLPEAEEAETAGEDVVLPHKEGFLWFQSSQPGEDTDYYAPVMARVKSSFISLEEPVERYYPPSQ